MRVTVGVAAACLLAVVALTIWENWPHRVRLGKVYQVPIESVCLYESQDLAAELAQLAPQFRWVRQDRLSQVGRARRVSQGVWVRVMERSEWLGVPLARVKVLDGDEAGYYGWISQDELRPRGE